MTLCKSLLKKDSDRAVLGHDGFRKRTRVMLLAPAPHRAKGKSGRKGVGGGGGSSSEEQRY